MKVLTFTEESANFQLSINELKVFRNALMEVCDHILDYEFKTRLQVSREEVKSLILEIEQVIEKMSLKRDN
jgi:hypothetical protein